MSKADDYHRRAAECLLLAKQAQDPANKTLLLKMAQIWARRAVRQREAQTKDE